MKYKNQHTVSQTYLKEWCDHLTPQGQEPYVWVVSKDGTGIANKAPKNVFSESDFYTVYDEAGNRNTQLEHELHNIEDDYVQVRAAIKDHKPIDDEGMLKLVSYISTSYARTQYQKSDQGLIWEELIGIYQSLGINEHMPALYSQVERLRDQPMPFMLTNFMRLTVPVLMKMNLTILETSRRKGFITSDNPVLWIDPSLLIPGFPLTFFGLDSPLLEILFPISPNQLTSLTWSGSEQYIFIDADQQMVNEVNKLIVSWSSESVILNHNQPKPYWFET